MISGSMHQAQWDNKDYHQILDLEYEAGTEDIKRAYRRLAKKFHPDVNPSPDAPKRFIEITEAYEILVSRSRQTCPAEYHEGPDAETLRAEYEKARKQAGESARRYARMKYEKFKQEQEAFKKSGWHDILLIFNYFVRILVFPLIAFLIAMPLVSKAVAEHPSGFVMFWLLACILILFVANNWKSYLNLEPFYYNFTDLAEGFRKAVMVTGEDCYYCKGHKAISFPYQVGFFKVRKIRLSYYGALYGRTTGIDRVFKKVKVPRSKKAVMVHVFCSLLKLSCIAACFIWIRKVPYSWFSLPAGILTGSLAAGLFAYTLSTKPKVGFLLSSGMIIKLGIWMLCIYFLQGYAILLLFFDPMIEAIIRQVTHDKWFVPLFSQHPGIDALLRNHYQFYMEFPVWSVIVPFFKWLF